MDTKKLKETALGGILNNPVFVLVLGMCPTIGMSTNVTNALGLGLATAFVLLFSNIFVSLLRKVIPDKVRLPSYIIIIATFVTLVKMFLEKFLPALYASIGQFIPLIVVNCIILGRAEAFAGKNSVGYQHGAWFYRVVGDIGRYTHGADRRGHVYLSNGGGRLYHARPIDGAV